MTAPNSDQASSHGADLESALHHPVVVEANEPESPEDVSASTLPGRSGSDSVQAMHDVLWREHAEPRDGFEPVPFWVSVVFGGLLAWGGYYIGSNSADFRRDVFDRSDLKMPEGAAANLPDPDPQTLDDYLKIGAQKFQSICAACHQPDGKGDPSKNIPPLDGSDWVVGKDKASPARLARILLYGLNGRIDVLGRSYNGEMPNQGNVFKDYEIASVLTYIRNNWGNKAAESSMPPIITTDMVRAARMKEGARKTNGTQKVTPEYLLGLPVTYSDGGTPASVPKAEEPKK
jgi:mono/diheme cytochrome c family protein